MSRLQRLKVFVNQRLTAAVDDIFGHFERTITEYEEEMELRHRKLLDVVLTREIKLRTAVFPADVQQLLEGKEEDPPEQQQERSLHLDQEEPAEPPHIKEEPQEVWSQQEGEQLQGLEDPDLTEFPFPPVPVKSEEDEEKPQSSQLHQRLTEQMERGADGEDCGGPGPASSSDSHGHLEPDCNGKSEDSSETEDSGDDWAESSEPQSGLNSLKLDDVPVSDSRCSSEKPFSCLECGKSFGTKRNLRTHMRFHTGEKPFSCSVCKKSFPWSGRLHKHMRTHTGEKPFSCSVCRKTFIESGNLRVHERTHTGERPFSCSVCGKTFTQGRYLSHHMTVHREEKQFSCTVCDRSFTLFKLLQNHQCVGEMSQLHQNQTENREAEPPTSSSAEQVKKKKSFCCTECGQRFGCKAYLKSHMRIHTGEEPISCSVCGRIFVLRSHLTEHMRRHTGERPFSCSVCKKRFRYSGNVWRHMKTHAGEKPLSVSDTNRRPEPAKSSHPDTQPDTEDISPLI